MKWGNMRSSSDYWQIGTAVFADARLKGERTQEQLAALYWMLFDAFCGALGIRGRNYVPAEERDGNLVFVMTSQVLGQNHAPTKTLLDRCLVLKKYLRKKVVIINTAMQISGKGAGPFYDLCEAAICRNCAAWITSSFRVRCSSFINVRMICRIWIR